MAVDNTEEENISGLSDDHQKVLAVVKNNDTEDGSDIASKMQHLTLVILKVSFVSKLY